MSLLVAFVVFAGAVAAAGAWGLGFFDRYHSLPEASAVVTTAEIASVLGRRPGRPECGTLGPVAYPESKRACRWGGQGRRGAFEVSLVRQPAAGWQSGTRFAKREFALDEPLERTRQVVTGVGDEAYCTVDHGPVDRQLCTFRDGNVVGEVSYATRPDAGPAPNRRATLITVVRSVAKRLADRA